jgi:2-methylcitrate dehydratase
LGGLGESYKIMECSMKAFPCEALSHVHITAVLNAIKDNDIAYDNAEEVTVTTIARVCDILFDPTKYRPESRETADHSLPYCMTAAIVDRKVTTQSFSDEKIHDPKIREVIDRIKGEASEEFDAMFPEKQPSKVVVKTKDGREFSEYREYPKGDPREPMTMEDLDNKFEALAIEIMSKEKIAEVKETIFTCEEMDARSFMDALVI